MNVTAPVMLTRAALDGMISRGRGSIVNVASLLAFSASLDDARLPRRAIYAATKSFLVTFSQVVAREVEGTGVRVQVVESAARDLMSASRTTHLPERYEKS